MGRRPHADPKRSWPTLLRHALRARLAARGRTIPEGLVIRHRKGFGGRPDSVEVRNDPIATETMTRFTPVTTPIGDDGRATEAFLDAAIGHADQMRRASARLAALVAFSHDPRLPPRHAVEAHPLIALALRLADDGQAGLSGEMDVRDGVMWTTDLRFTIRGTTVHLRNATTMRISFDGEWPETLGHLTDMPLAKVLELPRSGRLSIDAPVASLCIARSWVKDGRLHLELEAARVVSIDDTPAGEDGTWKTLEPIPWA